MKVAMVYQLFRMFMIAALLLTQIITSSYGVTRNKIKRINNITNVIGVGGVVNKELDLVNTTFPYECIFNFTTFNNPVLFSNSDFKIRVFFQDVIFNKEVVFANTIFSGLSDFTHAQFKGPTIFSEAKFTTTSFLWSEFDSTTVFYGATFKNDVNFVNASFLGDTRFDNARFEKSADFMGATFNLIPDFSETIFNGPVLFNECKFRNGVDFRRTYFKDKIYFTEKTDFPAGKLFVKWSQLKGRLCLTTEEMAHFSKGFTPISSDKLNLGIRRQKEYELVEIFYEKLRDNYLIQGDKSSADEVMYELASKRQEYIGDIGWWFYGATLGWGYKPIRLSCMVFLLILLFAYLMHNRFCHKVVIIIDKSLSEETKKLLLFDKNYKYKYIRNEVGFFAKIWYSVLFSASVLLSIKFKGEWVDNKDNKFISLVTFEWLLGKSLYILFIVFVKSHEFEFIKKLFSLASP